ncbi:MAG TPA: hypothetical protein VHR72_03200 [Gemmataceae bacterium]|nr:hypothetical protein [Gemmataceae bacterium]
MADKKSAPESIGMFFAELCLTSPEDGVMSLIRIVDTVSLQAPPIEFKAGDGVQPDHLKLVSLLRSTTPIPEVGLMIVCVGPNGNSQPIGIAPVTFEEFAPGQQVMAKNLVADFTIAWDGEGLYWIELRTNDSLVARSPLTVRLTK